MTTGFVSNLGIRRPMVVLVQLQQRNAKKEASSSSVRKSIRPKYIIDAVATKDPKFLQNVKYHTNDSQSRTRKWTSKNGIGFTNGPVSYHLGRTLAVARERLQKRSWTNVWRCPSAMHVGRGQSSLEIGFDHGLSNTLQILKTCMVV